MLLGVGPLPCWPIATGTNPLELARPRHSGEFPSTDAEFWQILRPDEGPGPRERQEAVSRMNRTFAAKAGPSHRWNLGLNGG
jgi:hypothetical protein